MQSAFDTRAAAFDPDQTTALTAAYELALKSFPEEQRLSTQTKSKLAKVIVNIGRECSRQKVALNPQEISSKATDFVRQLRTMVLLD